MILYIYLAIGVMFGIALFVIIGDQPWWKKLILCLFVVIFWPIPVIGFILEGFRWR